MSARFSCTLPVGCKYLGDGRSQFRIWAPAERELHLDLVDTHQSFVMEAEAAGYFTCVAPAPPGSQYYYRLSDGLRVPDPASRLQADDVHDPSVVVDPDSFVWQHTDWKGRPWVESVIYEVHPGCWGGFTGIAEQIPYLANLGVTAIELMPIADFPGRRNWGYDGVHPFAPDRVYGSPDDLKRLIDTAHGAGLCVYLDVVYNHFGPEGNYLARYAPDFFDPAGSSPWGAPIDFSRPQVREFFSYNALYWLQEYRFDGLRFDAVHTISDPAWLDEMASFVRANCEPGRHLHLMLENERNGVSHLEKDFDAQWNDDGHNVLHVLLTDEDEGYYANYADEPIRKLARVLESGFVYQGEPSPVHGNKPRGSPSGHLPPYRFILFLQNHDQVGNRAFGERLTELCHPQALRAAITLQLMCPQIPLLFMDEERASSTPFLFFTDFHGELAAAVREGRRREFSAFSAFQRASDQAHIPDPNAETSFERSGAFRREDSPRQHRHHAFYEELLALRRHYLLPHMDHLRIQQVDVLGRKALLARWSLNTERVLCILLNLADQPERAEAMEGQLLFESREGAGSAARRGEVWQYSASVFLESSKQPAHKHFIHDES